MNKRSISLRAFVAFFTAALILGRVFFAADARTPPLVVTTRIRVEEDEGTRLLYKTLHWDPSRTAVIICDMWNKHWCRGATRRVEELAPKLNGFVEKARERGVLIVHAPSATMGAYADHPARRRARDAPRAETLPKNINRWSGLLKHEEQKNWPVDQSDGGCDCDPKCTTAHPWTAQISAIRIAASDAVSDSGSEIWNLFEARGIEHVLMTGVHTNMCVIGRPFGLRNMARYGKEVVLVRDLTDTMYNSRKAPFVSHFTGTDLVTDYIERYVCPTMLSTDLTGGAPFRFKNDTRKKIVFLCAEGEYGSQYTIPVFARMLEREHGFCCEVLQGVPSKTGEPRHWLPDLSELDDADLAVLFVRRRALPASQMKHLKHYLAKGKPLVALRTSCHAFAPRGKKAEGLVSWDAFDREVLGCSYNFYPHGGMEVRVVPDAAGHPIAKGLEGPYRLKETMYRQLPLSDTCTVILKGKYVTIENGGERYIVKPEQKEPDQPVAWTNRYGRSKIFFTTLGSSRASFQTAWFKTLLTNAAVWALAE